ncbi:MAG TPA: glycosyltransferase family 4 protein, partial [Thermoflexales bacterium]|nr:glycosyltransferase family 4 protein [Thermoflexales bacterium]
LFYRNGVDVLIRACALLKDQKDVHVFVGGKGPDRPAMEKFIAENGLANTHLLGFIPDEDLVDYFRAADVFVLPTRTGEGFGLVIAEANACGVPVIATRSGAPEEIVQDGITGLLVPPENPAALADAITQLRRQPDLRREMGRAARLAAEKLDWERNVDQLEQILNSELGSQA